MWIPQRHSLNAGIEVFHYRRGHWVSVLDKYTAAVAAATTTAKEEVNKFLAM